MNANAKRRTTPVDAELAEALVRAANDALADLPLVTALRCTHRYSNIATRAVATRTGARLNRSHLRISGINIHVEGWTETLHGGHQVIEVPLRLTTEATIRTAAKPIERFVQRQRARRAQAAEIQATSEPRPWGRTTDGLYEIDHLDCDAGTLGHIGFDVDTPSGLRERIGRMVTTVIDNEDHDETANLIGIVLIKPVELAEDMRVDDTMLYIARPVPETIVMQMPGRRLGDLLDVTGRLADRIMQTAENGTSSPTPLLTITLSPDRMRVSHYINDRWPARVKEDQGEKP